jgi:hypothetical protein
MRTANSQAMREIVVVIMNPQEDKLGPLTPAPRTTLAELPVPKAPSKHSLIDDTPVLAVDDSTADFAINCIGGTLRAHKSILAARSPYFAGMFRFGGQVRPSSSLADAVPQF